MYSLLQNNTIHTLSGRDNTYMLLQTLFIAV